MRVLFFSPNGQPNGPRTRIVNFAKQSLKRGYKPVVVTKSFFHGDSYNHLKKNEKVRRETIKDIPTLWINTIEYNSNGFYRFVSELQFGYMAFCHSKRLVPSVVIADSVTPLSAIFGLVLAKTTGAKFVYQIRDVWPIALVHDGSLRKSSPLYFFFRFLEKTLYRHCDAICSTLPFAELHIKNSIGISKEYFYIRNGVDMKPFLDVEEYTGKLGSFVNCTYVGTMAHAHDIITFIKAFAILPKVIRDRFKVHLYGDGVKRAKAEQLAKNEGLQNIHFYGMIDRSLVSTVLGNSDLLIASVLDSEAYVFGANLNKLYDYFAAGRPVLFCGNIPNDEVRIAQCGFSLPPENPVAVASALEQFLELTDAQRMSMGKNGREYAHKEFNIDTLGEKFTTMLDSIVR